MTILDLSATTTTNIFVLIAAIAVAAIVVPVVLMFAFVFAARIFRRDRMNTNKSTMMTAVIATIRIRRFMVVVVVSSKIIMEHISFRG